MTVPLHTCPGGCGRNVAHHMVACKPCWFRLPKHLRDTVWRAIRGPGAGSPEHTDALIAAFDWYADNQLGGTT